MAAPAIGSQPGAWLARREREVGRSRAIIPGTEKRIRWHRGVENSRTAYALVYFHGFSATRQELAPVGDMIADRLQANLFETRLSGHGLEQGALVDVSAEDWLNDAAEALAVGAAIGEKLIVMGTSTGATLALAMSAHPAFEPVAVLVLISPNLATRDRNAEFLTWPGGPQLARLTIGATRQWEPGNDLQARYWSTRYPTDALVEMMRLVELARGRLPLNLKSGLLVIYSPEDRVVDTDRIVAAFEAARTPHKRLFAVPGTSDPGNHVLAGDIMSPENNDLLTDVVVAFIEEQQSAETGVE